jgi:DNA primase
VIDAKTLKANLDLVEIITQLGVKLRRRGSSFVALCPFHNENTASFCVNPRAQLFHCFGCGAGGDVFTFVQRLEHLTFPQAVQKLSRQAATAPARRA